MNESDEQLRFGEFELDCRRRELLRSGQFVDLQAKPLELLIHLAQNRDRTVSKAELFDCVWPDVVVGDTALSSALKDLRRVLGDDGAQQRIVRTFRRRGFRFVAPTHAVAPAQRPDAGGRALAPERHRDSRAALVGRRTELAALEAWLRQAIAGEPRLVLVLGEAGSGKTRLAEELQSIAARQDAIVGVGRCEELVSFPYRPFVGALGALMGGGDDAASELLGDDATPLRHILHPSSATRATRELGVHFDAARERGELFSAIARGVAHLASTRPTLIVLEDLHWGDDATLDLLAHLAFSWSRASRPDLVRCMLVATLRAPTEGDRVSRVISRIKRAPVARRLDLSGLHELATRRLIAAHGLPDADREAVREVQRLSGGNPLFVRELAAELAAGPRAGVELAPTLGSALHARLTGLSRDCLRALTVAAFIGERFGRMALAAAARADESDLVRWLEEALRARLLLAEGRAYRFDHPLVSELLRSRVPAEEVPRLHAAIADVLEDLYATAPGEHALEISEHLIHAAHEVAPARLVDYAARAGEQAFAVCAWGAAARHFAAAANAASDASTPERARLHFRAAVAFNHVPDAVACLEHYRAAVRLFEQCDDLRGIVWARMYLLRAQLTLAAVAYGSQPEIAPLEGALARMDRADAVLQGLALETISEAHWMAGRSADAVEAASRALVVGHNQRDDALCYHACMGLALAHFQGVNLRRALEFWREGLAHAERSRDPWLQTTPRSRIAIGELLVGDLEAAAASAADALERANRAQSPAEISMALATQSSLALLRGDLRAAEDLAREALGLVELTGYPWAGPVAIPVLASCCALRGRPADAEALLDQLVEPGRVFGEPGPAMQFVRDAYLAWLHATAHGARRPVKAAALRRLAGQAAQAGSDPFFLGAACAVAEALTRLGIEPSLDGVEGVLIAAAERGLVFSTGRPFLLARVLGLIERRRKRPAEALARFDEAIRVASSCGAALELALARREQAELLVDLGDPAGPEKLSESIARLSEIGAGPASV